MLKFPNWPFASRVAPPLETMTCTLPNASRRRINSSQRSGSSSTARSSGKARTTSTSGTPNWRARSMVIWFGFSRMAAWIRSLVSMRSF